jgi:hypothetical protein
VARDPCPGDEGKMQNCGGGSRRIYDLRFGIMRDCRVASLLAMTGAEDLVVRYIAPYDEGEDVSGVIRR